jgi:hypothetical protein
MPAADVEGVARFFEECRRSGSMLHLVIADDPDLLPSAGRSDRFSGGQRT